MCFRMTQKILQDVAGHKIVVPVYYQHILQYGVTILLFDHTHVPGPEILEAGGVQQTYRLGRTLLDPQGPGNFSIVQEGGSITLSVSHKHPHKNKILQRIVK